MFVHRSPAVTFSRSCDLSLRPTRVVAAVLQRDGGGGSGGGGRGGAASGGGGNGGGGVLVIPLPPRRWGGWLPKRPAGASKTYELDAVGAFVWDNIDGRTSVGQIIERLSRRYDLNLREAQVPTLGSLEMLLRKKLIGIKAQARQDGR